VNSIVADSDPRKVVIPLRQFDSEITAVPIAAKSDAESYDDDVLGGDFSLLFNGQRPLALLVETLDGGAFGRDRSKSENQLSPTRSYAVSL
jgi:hypothetical protein